MRRACILAGLSALLAGCQGRRATTQPRPQGDPELGALLEGVREETRVPGIAAAVVRGEGVVATAAAGLRRVDEAAALGTSDRFHLGSNTKAMTALVVARFVERGQLRWETTLAEAFPEWNASMDAAYRAIPIRDLLRHRAGIAPMMKDDYYQPTAGDIPALLGPSGTVTCTLADWAVFVRANMNDPQRPIVSPTTLALLHESLPTDRVPNGSPTGGDRIGYAMGWMTWDSPSDRVLFHEGSNDRNYAVVRILQRHGLAFLVAVNAGGERAWQAAARAIDRISARYGGG
jgi:CubicO group peptidase (beta-lactamase class C family)